MQLRTYVAKCIVLCKITLALLNVVKCTRKSYRLCYGLCSVLNLTCFGPGQHSSDFGTRHWSVHVHVLVLYIYSEGKKMKAEFPPVSQCISLQVFTHGDITHVKDAFLLTNVKVFEYQCSAESKKSNVF